MTPADILAAARQNVVGPYLPAREEWLMGWCGPGDLYGDPVASLAVSMGKVWYHWPGMWSKPPSLCLLEGMRLDTSRPEVRDLLVRCGCPEWARDVPAAVWCWGSGVEVADVLDPWEEITTDADPRNTRHFVRVSATGRGFMPNDAPNPRGLPVGAMLCVSLLPGGAGSVAHAKIGRSSTAAAPTHAAPFFDPPCDLDNDALAKAHADVIAVNAGCIVRVEGGWLVPLPGGGLGFFEEVNRGE